VRGVRNGASVSIIRRSSGTSPTISCKCRPRLSSHTQPVIPALDSSASQVRVRCVCARGVCVCVCVRVARTNIHAHGKILFEFLLRPGEAMHDSGRQALHVFLL